MNFTVEVSKEESGEFRALCPELGISTLDADPHSAVDKLKSLILDCMANDLPDFDQEVGTPSGMSGGNSELALLASRDGLKVLFAPRRPVRH